MIGLVVTLIILGLLLWLVEAILPIDPWIKMVIRVIIIVCVILYLLSAFGLMNYDLPIPRVR